MESLQKDGAATSAVDEHFAVGDRRRWGLLPMLTWEGPISKTLYCLRGRVGRQPFEVRAVGNACP
jgi:hypothetical protein